MREYILREYRETHNNHNGDTTYYFVKEGTDGMSMKSKTYTKITPASYRRVHAVMDALLTFGEVDLLVDDYYNHKYTARRWVATPLYVSRKQEGG